MCSAELRAEKERLRAAARAIRKSLSVGEKIRMDEEICRRLLAAREYAAADSLLLYSPLAGEVDIRPVIRRALAEGKRVALPRCGAEGEMTFYEVRSLDELHPGSFGILEPDADASRQVERDAGALCLLPGLAFDRAGGRLGYGMGYYDRYLTGYPGVKIGAVYSALLMEQLPRDCYDLPVDIVVTEKGVIPAASVARYSAQG